MKFRSFTVQAFKSQNSLIICSLAYKSRFFYTVLTLCAVSLTSASPVTHPESDVSALEDRQIILPRIIFGSYGAGLYTGRHVQSVKDEVKYAPGLNNASGALCHKFGTWSFQAPINDIAEPACQGLTSRALSWQRTGDKAMANPNVVVGTWSNRTLLTNEDGYRQTLIFVLADENRDTERLFYGMGACMTAITTLVYDCKY